jgi:FkbM family methyltransferase
MSQSPTSFRSVTRTLLRRLPMKPLLFKAIRPFVRLSERTYRHLHFSGPIRVDIDGSRGFEMMHWGHQIENDLFWAGFANNWEATSLRLWIRLAAQADAVYDIGANTGVFALAAKAVRPHAKVFAFEPVARVHAKLLDNVCRNGFDVVAVPAGVSNTSGAATIFDVASEHVYSASLDPTMLSGRTDLVETTIEVVRMDDFVQRHPADGTMLAKIDTERHELQVLEGFGTLLERRRPILLVEILDRAIGSQVEANLKGLNYTFYEVRERVGVFPAEHIGEAERNYLLCPREVADRVGLIQGVSHAELAPGDAKLAR